MDPAETAIRRRISWWRTWLRPRLQPPLQAMIAGGLWALATGACAGPSAALRAGRLNATEEGMATYYAPRLAGRRTASGERYDPKRFTAAHPALPFGTEVAVERVDVGLPAVVVRINDRCAAGKKIIDVSEAAARRLQMLRAGIVPVRLRVIRAAREPEP